jgi:hypothetical protein
MRMPAFHAHRAARRADQARVGLLRDLGFVVAFLAVLALVWLA